MTLTGMGFVYSNILEVPWELTLPHTCIYGVPSKEGDFAQDCTCAE